MAAFGGGVDSAGLPGAEGHGLPGKVAGLEGGVLEGVVAALGDWEW